MAEFTHGDELALSDVVAAARLAGMIPGTGRFSRAILAAGYRRTEQPSPDWELRADFPAAPRGACPDEWQPYHETGARPSHCRTCSEVTRPVTAPQPGGE